MNSTMKYFRRYSIAIFSAGIFITNVSLAKVKENIDYLSFAQGVIPISIEGDAKLLKIGMEHALLIIDGNPAGFSLAPQPGTQETKIVFNFKLPALTAFTDFAIANILETPSPSQTFIKTVEISGSSNGADGSFSELARKTLETHREKGLLTTLNVVSKTPVQWVATKLHWWH